MSTKPAPTSPSNVFRIWALAQLTAVVSSRARGSLMDMTPSTQTTISAAHIAASNQRGIERRTEGANVAATMPMHAAIENCSPVGAPTPTATRSRRRVLVGGSYVHNRDLARCMYG